MAVLEGRGRFWRADDPIPEGKFAPDSFVAGLLEINGDGSSSLELDGYLPHPQGPMASMMPGHIPAQKRIAGILKGSGHHVLLVGLTHGGGRPTSSYAYERYIAFRLRNVLDLSIAKNTAD